MVRIRNETLYEFASATKEVMRRVSAIADEIVEEDVGSLPENMERQVRRRTMAIREGLTEDARRLKLFAAVAERAAESYELCETRYAMRGEYGLSAQEAFINTAVNSIYQMNEWMQDIKLV